MLIERLMTVFARRYYECNPGFVTHLSSGKVDELKGAYDKFKRENAEGKAFGLEQLGPLVRSLGGDLKWMKDEEIEEMTAITPGEYLHVQAVYYDAVGLQVQPTPQDELEVIISKIHIAASLARKTSALAKIVKKEAEVAAALANVATKLGAEFEGEVLAEKLGLETKRLKDQLKALHHDIESATAERNAAEKICEDRASDVSIDVTTFLTMMAHKMGNDTAFVLAYSTIMLNTDAHNPRLTGQARMSKAAFISSNRA